MQPTRDRSPRWTPAAAATPYTTPTTSERRETSPSTSNCPFANEFRPVGSGVQIAQDFRHGVNLRRTRSHHSQQGYEDTQPWLLVGERPCLPVRGKRSFERMQSCEVTCRLS